MIVKQVPWTDFDFSCGLNLPYSHFTARRVENILLRDGEEGGTRYQI